MGEGSGWLVGMGEGYGDMEMELEGEGEGSREELDVYEPGERLCTGTYSA